MKNTNITKKTASIFAAATMIVTASICAAAETYPNRPLEEDTTPAFNTQSEKDEKDTFCGKESQIMFGIPRGGKIIVR